MSLTTVTWRPGLEITQDPDAIEVYRLRFTPWLRGEALQSVDILQDPQDVLTVDVIAQGTETVDIRVSGGAQGDVVAVTVRSSTGTGRQQDRTIRWRILDQ